MKRLFLITTILFFIAVKSFAQIQFPTSDSLISFLKGKWSWIYSCGGVSGGCRDSNYYANIYPDSIRYSLTFYFSEISNESDSILMQVQSMDSIYPQRRAKLTVISMTPNDSSFWLLEYFIDANKGYKFQRYVYTNYTDTLNILDGCADCFTHTTYRDFTLESPKMNPPKKKIIIYPNPGNQYIELQNDKNMQIESIQILDVNGCVIQHLSYNERRINISNLPSGIYFINVYSNQDVFRSRFIKE